MADEPAARDPFRWRLIWVAVIVAVVAASAAIVDGSVHPGAAAFSTPADNERTGAWFCPHGGGDGWKGWLTLTNPGHTAVHVRMTGFASNGPGSTTTFDVPARTQAVRQITAKDPAAGTEVEYFGGWVQASTTVTNGSGSRSQSTTVLCISGAGSDWYLAGLSTRVGETAFVVAMNPFAEIAEFDVALFTEKRALRPGTLSPLVVPPGRSVAIKLNQFALLGQGENALAVHVASRVGRVIVSGVEVTPRGMLAEAGVAGPAARWVLPAGGTSASLRLVAFNPGSARSDLSVVSQSATGQLLASGTNGLSVPAGGVQTFQLRVLPSAGVVVQSSNGQPVVVAGRAERPSGDVTIVGGPRPGSTADRWLVVAGIAPRAGQSFLVLQDPGSADARVHVTWLGPAGQVDAPPQQPVTVPAGRILQFPVPAVAGRLASALVQVISGEVVSATWSSPGTGSGFIVVLGLPVPAGA